jgi:hypothetical protein
VWGVCVDSAVTVSSSKAGLTTAQASHAQHRVAPDLAVSDPGRGSGV